MKQGLFVTLLLIMVAANAQDTVFLPPNIYGYQHIPNTPNEPYYYLNNKRMPLVDSPYVPLGRCIVSGCLDTSSTFTPVGHEGIAIYYEYPSPSVCTPLYFVLLDKICDVLLAMVIILILNLFKKKTMKYILFFALFTSGMAGKSQTKANRTDSLLHAVKNLDDRFGSIQLYQDNMKKSYISLLKSYWLTLENVQEIVQRLDSLQRRVDSLEVQLKGGFMYLPHWLGDPRQVIPDSNNRFQILDPMPPYHGGINPGTSLQYVPSMSVSSDSVTVRPGCHPSVSKQQPNIP